MDKIIVTSVGVFLIALIYWFFFGKKDEMIQAKGLVKIKVEGGYKPNQISVKSGEETMLEFTRTDKNPCLEEVVFPELKIKEYLPLNTPVVIKITPQNKGEYSFHCSMNMNFGKIVAS